MQGTQYGQGFAGILTASKGIVKKSAGKPTAPKSKTSVKKKKAK
ncbi:hypothetical protein [Danxiaibacter flavus]